VLRFRTLKYLSFAHSAVYAGLLALWLLEGPEGLKTAFGWAHGVGWIAMSLLCIAAVRRHVIPLWLAVMVVVVGGVGPFAGTAGFLVAERRIPASDAVWSRS
jgi:hypothetical protein